MVLSNGAVDVRLRSWARPARRRGSGALAAAAAAVALLRAAPGASQLDLRSSKGGGPRTHAASAGSAYGSWSVACSTCHTLHPGASANIALVRDVIQTPSSGPMNVVFRLDDVLGGTNPGGLPADNPARLSFLGDWSGSGNGPYTDGVCEVCHTRTRYHRNSDPGGDHSHNAAYRCTSCHEHRTGFLASSIDCLGCHSTARGPRRSVAADFSAGGAHPLTYDRAALADPQRNECLKCHEERVGSANHPNGGVDPSPDPDRSGASEGSGVYPSWWCVECHDASTPGSLGGRGAPDETVHFQSTHTRTPSPSPPAQCGWCHLGDPQRTWNAELYPYDGNAHAPRLANFYYVSSSARSAIPVRREEDVCFVCHGGFTNVGRYDEPGCPPRNKTYMENVLVSMRGNGVTRNFPRGSRHLSTEPDDGAVVCRRCHDPHRIDRYSGKLIFDPQSPSQAWPWSGNGTTPDSFCARCHDGTTAAVPVHAGVPLGTKRCAECHLPHGSTNPKLLYVSEAEMAAVAIGVAPGAVSLAVGEETSLSAAPGGVPADRPIPVQWSVRTTSGGSTPVTYTASAPLSIADPAAFRPDGGVTSKITVPDAFTVQDLDVRVDASHPAAADLSVLLIHEETGTRALLKSDGCWSCTTYTPTWYDQEQRVVGSERGLERLDAFAGESAQGTWTLVVTDHWPGDAGTLSSWTLSFNGGVVATVDQSGRVRAVAPGSAVVEASLHSGRVRLTSLCASWWDLTETVVTAGAAVTVVGGRPAAADVTPSAAILSGAELLRHVPGALGPGPFRSPRAPKAGVRCEACHEAGR